MHQSNGHAANGKLLVVTIPKRQTALPPRNRQPVWTHEPLPGRPTKPKKKRNAIRERIETSRRPKQPAKLAELSPQIQHRNAAYEAFAEQWAQSGGDPLALLACELGADPHNPKALRPPTLITLVWVWARQITGNGDAAAVLSIVLYAMGKRKTGKSKRQRMATVGKDGRNWAGMSRERMAKRLGLSTDQMDRKVDRLAEAGLIERARGRLRPAWGAIRNAVRALRGLLPVETPDDLTTNGLLELLASDIGDFAANRKTTWHQSMRRAIRRELPKAATGGDLTLILGQMIYWSTPKLENGELTPQLTAGDDGYWWWKGRWDSLGKAVGLSEQQARRAVRALAKLGAVVQRPADKEVWLRLAYLRVWSMARQNYRKRLKSLTAGDAEAAVTRLENLVALGPSLSE